MRKLSDRCGGAGVYHCNSGALVWIRQQFCYIFRGWARFIAAAWLETISCTLLCSAKRAFPWLLLQFFCNVFFPGVGASLIYCTAGLFRLVFVLCFRIVVMCFRIVVMLYCCVYLPALEFGRLVARVGCWFQWFVSVLSKPR